ncbi:MAG: hypothetical protein BWZ02_01312 [Lentisphaerae bacterium ADurb.BinA184]|nr:MAG: hypothetical protein BWZ02_01312 [Lentisphaerae bacterium ADurb.BinA184]
MDARKPYRSGDRRLASAWLLLAGLLCVASLRAADDAPANGAADATPPEATAAAAEPAAMEAEAAPAEPAAPPTQIQRVQAALTQAVVRLRDPARKDDDRFFVPPVRQRRVVDWKEVDVRYSKVTIDEPIYEYETYKTIASVKTDDSITAERKLDTVVRRRIKRQTGTRQVERLIYDPEGDVVVRQKHPIYGPGGPNVLFPGFYGENALCLYACIKCGVPPEDELFARTSQRLADYLDAYGLPDRTWDLAWLTVAFSNLPKTGELTQALTRRMVRKLLLGQVTEGSGAGLWGPVAIHPTLLARMIEYERKVYERKVQPWEEKLKESPDRERYQEKLEEAKALINGFREQYGDIAQQGLQFERLREQAVIPAREAAKGRLGWGVEEGAMHGLPVFIYGETWADVEHTSLVLFALREAQVNGYLPEKVDPPRDLDEGWIGEPVESGAVIDRGLAALAKLVDAKGMCAEGVFRSPVHAFDKIGVLGVPVDDRTFQPVAARTTVASIAQAQAGLMDADQLAAGRRGTSAVTPKLVAARRNLRQMVEAFLDDELKGIEEGGHVNPYDLIFQLSRSLGSRGEHPAVDRETWRGLADLLLSRQLADGAWRGKGNGLNLQPSLRESIELRVREYMQSVKANIPRRQPGWNAKKEEEHVLAGWRAHYGGRVSTDLVSTAYAAILLSEGLRPPVIGVWAWDGKPPRTVTAAQVVERLAEENSVHLRYTVLAPDLPAAAVEGIPALSVSGMGAFTPADATATGRLAEFLKTGGLLLVEHPADAGGQAFGDAVRQAILDALPDFQESRITATEKMPEVRIVNNAEGRVGVVFLPAEVPGAAASPGALKFAQAKEACFQLVLRAVDPAFLKPGYAIAFDQALALEKQHFEDEMAARQKQLEEAGKPDDASGEAATP